MTTTLTVFGSCNMDLVAYVEAAPARGETVVGREFHTVAGGKGANQAIAAAMSDARVHMLGAVGDDEFGDQIRDNLVSRGIRTEGLRTVSERSGTAHIVVDDRGGNSIVAVPGANAAMDGLRPGDEEFIGASDGLLLQLEIPLAGVQAAAAAARRGGAQVVLTPAPAAELPADLLSLVDLLVPNEHEAAVLVGTDEPQRALSKLLELVPEVVITLGSRGVLYGNRSGDVLQFPSFQVSAVDTTAAGDTFTGVLAVARAEGRDMREALRLASAAAALSVQRHGASGSMPSRAEIAKFLRTTDETDS